MSPRKEESKNQLSIFTFQTTVRKKKTIITSVLFLCFWEYSRDDWSYGLMIKLMHKRPVKTILLCHLSNYLLMQDIILDKKNVTSKTVDSLLIILSIRVFPFLMIVLL